MKSDLLLNRAILWYIVGILYRTTSPDDPVYLLFGLLAAYSIFRSVQEMR